MNEPLSKVVYPVILRALDVKDRLDRGESPDIAAEQRALLELLRGNAEVQRNTDYTGDRGDFLGARYALACWVDELFIVYCPAWSEQWKNWVLEQELFGTRHRAWKFWVQLDVALKRPKAPTATVTIGPDVLETFFLAIALGFRGKPEDGPRNIRDELNALRPQFSLATPWRPPRELGVETNVEPLLGRQALLQTLWVYGGALVGVLLLAGVLVVVARS